MYVHVYIFTIIMLQALGSVQYIMSSAVSAMSCELQHNFSDFSATQAEFQTGAEVSYSAAEKGGTWGAAHQA